MISFPNAKINLGLLITEKRPDGFHNLETVFYPVPWTDILEVIIGDGAPFEMTMSGLAVNGSLESNLCYKAWKLLATAHNLPPLKAHLHKIIPMGAGLGGGSSDASFMLKMINSVCELHLNDQYLADLATQLGSDCPFFVHNQPMLATGRGEILEPISVSLADHQIIIVMPPLTVGTAEAYSWITPKPTVSSVKGVISQPISQWQSTLINDFENPVFAHYPAIKIIKQQLLDAGAIYASLSGSGAAVFGIFKTIPQEKIKFNNCQVFTGSL
jgi:4-diphosphocytidyl-2-C-methyl-D-erythritol kinase